MKTAPIALFVYNRPWHTQQVVASLLANDLASTSDCIIFADGKKSNDRSNHVDAVRAYLTTIVGFKSITIIERTKNIGLAESLITGITEILNSYDKIIVLEDDITTSPYFLTFMNKALDVYAHHKEIGSISAFMYPALTDLPINFFLKYPDCWGWGTWKHAWNLFEPDGKKLLSDLKKQNLEHEFDVHGTYPFTDMLEQQIKGAIDSWAIRWRASLFLANKLNLYPNQSLVKNIGFDGSGVHGGHAQDFVSNYSNKLIDVIPIAIEENSKAVSSLTYFFKTVKKKTLLHHFLHIIKIQIPPFIRKKIKALLYD